LFSNAFVFMPVVICPYNAEQIEVIIEIRNH